MKRRRVNAGWGLGMKGCGGCSSRLANFGNDLHAFTLVSTYKRGAYFGDDGGEGVTRRFPMLPRCVQRLRRRVFNMKDVKEEGNSGRGRPFSLVAAAVLLGNERCARARHFGNVLRAFTLLFFCVPLDKRSCARK